MSEQMSDDGTAPDYDTRSPTERVWDEGDSHIRRIFQQPPNPRPRRRAGGELGNAEALCPVCGAYWDCEHKDHTAKAGLRPLDPKARPNEKNKI